MLPSRKRKVEALGEESQGGFNVEWFVDQKAIQEYLCCVCMDVSRECVTTQCGHGFCRTCVSNLKNCPVCNEAVTALESNKFILRLINNLAVYCQNKALCDNAGSVEGRLIEGCKWQGSLLERLQNHPKTCDFESVLCEDCKTAWCERRKLSSHKEVECSHRFVQCEYCNEKIRLAELSEHTSFCNAMTRCPNEDCKESPIPRSQLALHRNVCQFESVECKYIESLGCSMRRQRHDIANHHADASFHFPLLLARYQAAQRTIEQLRTTIEENEEKISNARRKLRRHNIYWKREFQKEELLEDRAITSPVYSFGCYRFQLKTREGLWLLCESGSYPVEVVYRFYAWDVEAGTKLPLAVIFKNTFEDDYSSFGLDHDDVLNLELPPRFKLGCTFSVLDEDWIGSDEDQ